MLSESQSIDSAGPLFREIAAAAALRLDSQHRAYFAAELLFAHGKLANFRQHDFAEFAARRSQIVGNVG